MRRVTRCKAFEPIQWIGMRHEADCWIAACAMAAGATYEEAERAFGSGLDYSNQALKTSNERSSDDPNVSLTARNINRLYKMFLHFQQWAFFTERGYHAILLGGVDPHLRRGSRYLLSARCYDPKDPDMCHLIVVSEEGKVFDPDPKFTPESNDYLLSNYRELVGWEIVKYSL